MAIGFLSPATKVKALEEQGESGMKASLARGMPHGYEVGYCSFTINGRVLHHKTEEMSESSLPFVRVRRPGLSPFFIPV